MSLTVDEIVARGRSLYERLLPHLLPEQQGQYIVINVETGEYELDPDD